jgi:lysophospholipase L1-like esterase
MSNNAMEAYPGHTIDQVQQLALSSGAYQYIPNVFLVHLGTNDCQPASGENSTIAAERFTALLASIKQQNPNATVLASTLIQNLDTAVNTCISHFNSHLPGIVSAAQKGGHNVTLVDMHSAVPRSQLNTTDGTHPTDAGYAIMAGVWYQGLVNASGVGMLEKPASNGKSPPQSPSAAARTARVEWLSCAGVAALMAVLIVMS